MSEPLIQELQDVCERYLTYHVATICIVAKLNNHTQLIDSQKMMGNIRAALLKGEHYECSEGLFALEITTDKKVKNEMMHFILDYVVYAQNWRVLEFIRWIRIYFVDGKLQKRMWLHKMNELLCRVADSIEDFSGEEEYRMDMMFQTNKLAGAVYAKWGEMEGVNRWKEITMNRRNFNDVRAGFDLGQELVIKDKDELNNRLLLHG